ncbi:MAG: hypothetical protein KGD73_04300 [Candidatus Lokiarchaeota archaeon]|nr:hypothetical protein [Candidatus Lokiarchaeota archaeon]
MKDKIILFTIINIILIIVVLILYAYFNELTQSNLGFSNFIFLIIGIEFLLLSILIAFRIIKKSKIIALEREQFQVKSYFKKYSFIMTFTLTVGFILFFLNINDLSYVDYYVNIETVIIIIIIAFCLLSSLISLIYYRYLKKYIVTKRTDIMKFRSIIKGREKLSIFELENIFKDDKEFYEKLLKWIEQFNFRIDGEMLILNEENIEDFIVLLDKQYEDWNKKERAKYKKIY